MNDRASNMDVKKINRVNTLRCIFACERISQPELTQKLGVSWPTVLQNVKELLELGLVEEVGAYESTGGRKARAFAPIRDARLAFVFFYRINKKSYNQMVVELTLRKEEALK